MGTADDFPAEQRATGFRLRIGDAFLLSLLVHGLLISVNGGQWRLGSATGNPPSLTVRLPDRRSNSIAPTVQTPLPRVDSLEPGRTNGPPDEAAAAPSNPPQPRGLILGEWYYPARYLHARPIPMRPIQPIYPTDKETLAGRIVMLLFINETGTVDNYRIVESDPPGDFDPSAIEAFLAARFFPGKIAGIPVRSQIKVEIRYIPDAVPRATIIESP